jgi:hypothetical protein
MSLISKLQQVAKSEKGKELIEKAQAMANDPKTREKIADARGKVEGQIDAAKHKLAEKRGKDGEPSTGAPAEPPAGATAGASAPPPPPPAYGGDDGPKAA